MLQAKSFALLTEEGIAKGVRRIVAVTAADADAAIAAGNELLAQVGSGVWEQLHASRVVCVHSRV